MNEGIRIAAAVCAAAFVLAGCDAGSDDGPWDARDAADGSDDARDGAPDDGGVDVPPDAPDGSDTGDADGTGDASDAPDVPEAADRGDTGRGDPVGRMAVTYYWVSREADFEGAADTVLYDSDCDPIATVPSAFSDAVCVEGTGILRDGHLINYDSSCSCGRACPSGGIVCYAVLDATGFPWGMGSRSNPLVPLRSWAVDNGVVPFGTVLYAEEWDGTPIPAIDGIGGFVHDGCFRADDVGGWISGMRFDFFAGTESMWEALEDLHPSFSEFTVFRGGDRCGYLAP